MFIFLIRHVFITRLLKDSFLKTNAQNIKIIVPYTFIGLPKNYDKVLSEQKI